MLKLVKKPLPRVVKADISQNDPEVILVNRNQNAYQVIRRVQQNKFGGQNSIANVVE